jgi:MmyB-like transcription regulator ligand binding domain
VTVHRLRRDAGRPAKRGSLDGVLAASASTLTVSTGNRLVKRFHHPEGGTIDVAVEILDVADARDQQLVVLVPAPGSADDRAWRDVMGRTDPSVTAITHTTGSG